MTDMLANEGLENWLSTYQSLTIGQLLEEYGLSLADSDVIVMLSKKSAFYYQILTVPLLNVLNGIILGQTKEYQLFLQKMFVDYLMSGQSDQPATELGGEMRHQIEAERVESLAISEKFEQTWREYENTIALSQAEIKTFATKLIEKLNACQHILQTQLPPDDKTKVKVKDLHTLFVDADGFEIQANGWSRLEKKLPQSSLANLRESLMPELEKIKDLQPLVETVTTTYLPVVKEQRRLLNQYRKTFYEKIGVVQLLLYQMPGFQIDELEDAKNRARLNFDSQVGADNEADA